MKIAVRVCAALILAAVAVAEPLTTGTLVSQMTDLYRLAEFPEPFYKTVQFSSYDHRSTVPGGPDWFANSDGFGQEPVPNFEAVITEPDANGIGEYLVCDVNKIHFYQVQVRLYQGNRDVTTFTPGDLKTYADEIRHAAEMLKDPQTRWPYRSGDSPHAIHVNVEPGARTEALKLEGPGAIERLTLRVTADDLDAALRQTILYIRFDDYPSSQVQSPIGDFFGAAPGVNPYDSAPFTVAADGTMTCRYVMPFAKNAAIFFENLGTQAVTIQGEALSGEYAWDADRSMHFRARWRIDHGLTASGAEPHDIPFLVANGAGVYVGSVTYVLNPNDVPSPGGNWWGEGDEKIFVDSDVRPSTFGTGSEDYYNYAWSSPDIFGCPYCGQPRNDGPANRGFVTNNRWHVVDDLPFENRIAFYMELFPHELNHGMAYGRIGYHYGRPGIMDDHIVITPEDVRNQALPRWMPAARGAASNAVFYQAEQVDAPRDGVYLEAGELWAGGNIYRWYPKNVGDTVAFTVPFKESGTYAIQAVLAHDRKSGKVTMLFNDKECGTWDLHDASREMLRAMHGGDHDVAAGDHTIAFRFDGGETSLGVDFFWIQKR